MSASTFACTQINESFNKKDARAVKSSIAITTDWRHIYGRGSCTRALHYWLITISWTITKVLQRLNHLLEQNF